MATSKEGRQIKKKNTIYEKIRNGAIPPEEVDPKDARIAFKSTVESRKNKSGVTFGTKGAPSKAQIELLKQYKCETGRDVVTNTIDEIIDESLPQIKEAVENMMKYHDKEVFEVLPKDLDEKMRAYGMIAQEYFTRGKKPPVVTDPNPVLVVPTNTRLCPKCMKYKRIDSTSDFFYRRVNKDLGEYVPICKDCCEKLFIELAEKYGPREALIVMCQKLDIMVLNYAVEKHTKKYETPEGKEDLAHGVFFGCFYKDIICQHNVNKREADGDFCHTNLNGIPFKQIADKKSGDGIYNDILEEALDDEEDAGKYPSTPKLKKKWGNFKVADLHWLEDKYLEWYDKCEIDGLSRDKLVKQLCYEELSIVRSRESGAANKEIQPSVSSFQKLMKDADLTPKKQSAASSDSQFTSLGEFIRAAERTGPIINKNPDFEDVDHIQKLWRSIAGAISRTLCKDSEYVKDFEENYKEHSVSLVKGDSPQIEENADG